MSSTKFTILVFLALFCHTAYAQWIVTVVYNNWDCADNTTGAVQSVYSVKNDTCVWSQKGQSFIWAAHGGQIRKSLFASTDCSGMSSTNNQPFLDGECVRSTGSNNPRSEKALIQGTYYLPSGTLNAKEERTYSNFSACVAGGSSDDNLVAHRWTNYQAWQNVFNGTASNSVLGDCSPRPFISSFQLYDYVTCNSTHQLHSVCSDPGCTDCTFEDVSAISSDCLSSPTYQYQGGAPMPTREVCLAQNYNSGRTFGSRSPTYRNFAKPVIPAGISHILLQSHDISCSNESSNGYLVLGNNSCVELNDGGGFFRAISRDYDPAASTINYMCNETGLYWRSCSSCPSFCGNWTAASSSDCLPYRGDANVRISHQCIGTSDPWPGVNASSTFASYRDTPTCNTLSSPTFFNNSIQFFAGKFVSSLSCSPAGKYFRTGFCNSTYAANLACVDSACQNCFAEQVSSLSFQPRPNCQGANINAGLLYWGVPNPTFAYYFQPSAACAGSNVLNVTRVPVPAELAAQLAPVQAPTSLSAPVQAPMSSSAPTQVPTSQNPSVGAPSSSVPITTQPSNNSTSSPTAESPAGGSSGSNSNNNPSIAGSGTPSSSSSASPLTGGPIAGIVIACFIAVILILVICFLLVIPRFAGKKCCCCIFCACCARRRKNKKEKDSNAAVATVALTNTNDEKDASSSESSGSDSSKSSQSQSESDSEADESSS